MHTYCLNNKIPNNRLKLRISKVISTPSTSY